MEYVSCWKFHSLSTPDLTNGYITISLRIYIGSLGHKQLWNIYIYDYILCVV